MSCLNVTQIPENTHDYAVELGVAAGIQLRFMSSLGGSSSPARLCDRYESPWETDADFVFHLETLVFVSDVVLPDLVPDLAGKTEKYVGFCSWCFCDCRFIS